MVPKESEVGTGISAAVKELLAKHGEKGLLPLLRENNAYNFHLSESCSPIGGPHPLGSGGLCLKSL